MSPAPKPPPPSVEAVPRKVPVVSAQRQAAIGELLLKGYVDPDGRPHKVHSAAHAEFLARAGTVTLPK